MLQAKIVVEPARAMLLDDKFQFLFFHPSHLARGLRGYIEAPPPVIFGELTELTEIGRL